MLRTCCMTLVALGVLVLSALACAPYEGDWFASQEDEFVNRASTFHARIGGGAFTLYVLDVTDHVDETERRSSGLRGRLGESLQPDDNTFMFKIVDAEAWDHVQDTWSATDVSNTPYIGFAHFNGGEEHLQISFMTAEMESVAEGSIWRDRMWRDRDNRFPE